MPQVSQTIAVQVVESLNMPNLLLDSVCLEVGVFDARPPQIVQHHSRIWLVKSKNSVHFF